MTDQLPIVLLVEDNPGDVELTRQGIVRAASAQVDLRVARDGAEAIDYLEACDQGDGPPWPELVLLDLNLPKLSGFEVLERIKSDPVLRRIPVIVLSTSSSPSDVAQAYQLQANAYVTKPVDFHSFVDVIEGITRFWLTLARRPSGSGS